MIEEQHEAKAQIKNRNITEENNNIIKHNHHGTET